MRKFVMMFLIILCQTTISFSQNISDKIINDSTVSITTKQLKEANLIFVEHQKLILENDLLNKQLVNYKLDNKTLETINSLQQSQIENYQLLSKSYEEQVKILNTQIKKKNTRLLFWKIGGVTVTTSLLLLLLLK